MQKLNVALPLAAGCPDALATAGVAFEIAPDGFYASDATQAQAIINGYAGSATELAWHKADILAQLGNLCLSKYAGGFNYSGADNVQRNFQIDPQSQFNIDVQANASLGAIMNGEAWDSNSYFIASDNSHMPTPTPQAMRAFSLAARAYVAGLILHNRALKDQINAAADLATLQAIDITAGWPGNP